MGSVDRERDGEQVEEGGGRKEGSQRRSTEACGGSWKKTASCLLHYYITLVDKKNATSSKDITAYSKSGSEGNAAP